MENSITTSTNMSKTSLETWVNVHLQHSGLPDGPVIHAPWLEHALRTLQVRLSDKKVRKKLEEIIEQMNYYSKISIENFATCRYTKFYETSSELANFERPADAIHAKNIIWTHKVFRFIKRLNHKYLDVDMFQNVEEYRSEDRFFHPAELKKLLFSQLDNYETSILTLYYTELVDCTSNVSNFKDVDFKKMKRYLTLINQYVKGYILNIITNAIKKFIRVFTDPDLTPYMELSVHYYNGNIVIKPSLNKIKKYHTAVLKKIASLGSSWEYLGKALSKTSELMSIRHEDDFLKIQEDIMLANLEKLVHPLMETFGLLERELSEISQSCFNEKPHQLRSRGVTDKTYWIMWQEKITNMNDVDFNGIFRLLQEPMKMTLLSLVKLQTTQSLCELIYEHLDLNLKIRKETNSVKERCRKIPCTSEELVAVAKYMNICSTQWILGLRFRTKHLLKMTTELMDAIELTSEHAEFVCGTIGLLKSIKASFKEFRQMFAATKDEMEERLRTTTENLNRDLEEFGNNYLEAFNYFDRKTHLLSYVQYCSKYLRSIEAFDERVAWINKEESLLNIVLSTYPELDEIKMIVFPLAKLILVVYKWLRTYSCYMDGSFEPETFEEVEQVVEENYRLINGMNNSFKAKIRQHIVDNYPKRFKGMLDDPDFNAWPSPIKIAHFGLEALNHIKNQFVLIQMLANPHLQDRHWKELSTIVGYDLTPNKGSSLRQFIGYKLDGYYEKIQIISTAASREAVLQETFERMQDEWASVEFQITRIKNQDAMGPIDPILDILDRHMNETVSMRGSAFVKPIKDHIDRWYNFLVTTNVTLDKWCEVQEQWISFLGIFSIESISESIEKESQVYKAVDQDYRTLLQRIKAEPMVRRVCEDTVVLPLLNDCLSRLEIIRRGVDAYLLNIRLSFPRMFFLSNRELMCILSETSDPHAIEPYIYQCFEGTLRFSLNESNAIQSVISSTNEELKFLSPVSTTDVQGNVEKWLKKVESAMFEAIKFSIKKGISQLLSESELESLWDLPCQVVLCAHKVLWTAQVQTALANKNGLKAISVETDVNLSKLHATYSKTLPCHTRLLLASLLAHEAYSQSITKELLAKSVSSPRDFIWISQMRYYWTSNNAFVEMLLSTVTYGHEFVGNGFYNVETPATDRCYRSLLLAYLVHLYGALVGPSGVGKTDTLRSLCRKMAVKCVIHSCSTGIELSTIELFLCGASSCGAWLCFKDMDKVDKAVTSVLTQHLLSISQAVMGSCEFFHLNGLKLRIDGSFMVSATLKLTDSRAFLPGETRVMFRPIPLVEPDKLLIIEVTLRSFGFSQAKLLGSKLISVMNIHKEFSSMKPYHFGLRTIASIMKVTDGLISTNPEHCENDIIKSAIKIVMIPQLPSHDTIDFSKVLDDKFGSKTLPSTQTTATNFFLEEYAKRNLFCDEKCLSTIESIYEVVTRSQCIIICGPPFAGKTQFIQILYELLKSQSNQQSPEMVVINPNIISSDHLYGILDPLTSKWTDGIVSRALRSFSSSAKLSRNVLVFDGHISESWTDGLSTVLDDSHKLCLRSGEIIPLHSNSILIFEVDHLNQASPAHVSRCGLVTFDSMKDGWLILVRHWVDSVPPEWRDKGVGEKLEMLLTWLLPPCLGFIVDSCTKVIDDGAYHGVLTALRATEFELASAYSVNSDSMPNGTWTIAAVVLGIVWGLGGSLDVSSRQKFDVFLKDLYTGLVVQNPIPDEYDVTEMTLPIDGSLYDFRYLFRVKGGWKNFSDIVKTVKLDDELDYGNMCIPTTETLKYLSTIKHGIKENNPILLSGPSGTGKSFYPRYIMGQDLATDSYSLTTITLTGTMTPKQLQGIVLSRLSKLRKGFYSSPPGKKSIIFIDDLSVPCLGGDHLSIHELIRQYYDHSFWYGKQNIVTALINVAKLTVGQTADSSNQYDSEDLCKLTLKDVYFFGSVGNAGVTTNPISPRLLRHFSILALTSFADETIHRIFSNILLLGLRKNGFPVDINTTVNAITTATLFLYRKIIDFLHPTPTNCQYVYSLKDISKVWNGITLARKETADNKRAFIRLWIHEILRVFGDRVISNEDQTWFFKQLQEAITEIFKEDISTVLDNLSQDDEELEYGNLVDLIFTSGIVGDVTDERKYEEATLADYQRFVLKTLTDYNASHETKMDIILFSYTLHHVARLCRVFIMPGASIMLIGIGGSGRRSFIKLAAAVGGETVVNIQGSANYGFDEWRSDVKTVMKLSGGEDKETIFVFSEFKTNEEFYYQDMDALLISGEVPNLFVNEELQDILEMTRLAAQGGNRNLDISPSTVFQYFVQRSKKNLHLVLCLSPVGKGFRRKLRFYPSFASCCLINWCEGWPKGAVDAIAEVYMNDIDIDKDVKASVTNVGAEIHFRAIKTAEVLCKEYGRRTHIIPNVFLTFMELFRKTYSRKLVELTTLRERYVNGLSKLAAAEKQVFSMQNDLVVLQPQLEAAMEEAKFMLENVEKERIAVDRASFHVKEDEKIANIQAEAAIALKTECENDLALAIPILEDAIEALNTLKPTDITLVKSMKNPPDTVKLVMAAVCVMKDVKPDRVPDPTNPGRKIMDFWGPSKRILGDMAFLQTLKDYDKDNIPPHIMQTIRKVYIPNKDFRPHVVAKASSAAEGLCKWVLAMDKYDTVVKMVAPKKKKLATAEEEYGRTVGLLEEKRAELMLLQDKLKDLNTTLSVAVNQKQKFQKDVDLCAQKLRKAEAIIESLFSEKERWNIQVTTLTEAMETITGDILISSAGLAYLGPFPKALREKSLSEWITLLNEVGIPVCNHFDFTKILMNPNEVESWILAGLPNDASSIQSGIILYHVEKWPLCIDPHRQANQWIRSRVLVNGYITKCREENCLSLLQDAMEKGCHILIEDVADHNDHYSSSFVDLLSHPFDIRNGLVMNGKFIKFHRDFRLFMTSEKHNPYYLPQAYNKIVVIDFTLCDLGLVEQLMTTMVEIERKEISLDLNSFIQIRSSNKRILKEAEDAILDLLSTESNIVGDHTSVEKLRLCKETSRKAQKKENESEKLQKIIDDAREIYIPLANYSASLFSTIMDLEKIDPFYQYSVSWFISKFIKSIEITKHDEIDLDLRISNLKSDFTMSLHKSIIASVQNKHKLLVSFLIWATVLKFEGKITECDWKTFNHSIVWIKPTENFCQTVNERLSHLGENEAFKGLYENFQTNTDDWNKILSAEEFHSSDIPSPFRENLTDFQRTILLIIIRPDKVVRLMRRFLSESSSKMCELEYQLTSIFKDSDRLTPIIFSLVGGSDATPFILDLHEKLGFADTVKILTLGKDQACKVNRVLQESAKDGCWICLQNCEVADFKWLANFSSLLDAKQLHSVNLNFRIFMTFGSRANKMPITLLRNCLKISVEVTDNLKSSLWENYHTGLVGSNEFYNCCGKKQNVFAKLLFGISFLHGVVKEREKFGSRGWNHPYHFDECDYSISIKNLQYMVQTSNVPPIDAVSYIIGHITHGGKITTKWDQRVLDTLISKYVNKDILGTMGFCLCGSDEKYVIPIGYSQMDYITFINSLPDFTSPKVLGFQSSSSVVRDAEEGAQLYQAAQKMLGKTESIDVFDEKTVMEVIRSLLEKIASADELLENQDESKDYQGSFHRKESKCFLSLLHTMRSTLDTLHHSCTGADVLTTDQELIINRLVTNRLPDHWMKKSYSSVKSLSAYIHNFLERLQNHARWEQVRKSGHHWLPGFFNPRTFLTAKINDCCQALEINISDLKLDYSLRSETRLQSNRNFQIYGLYTDSCRWNPEKHILEEQSDAIQHEELPIMNVEVIDAKEFSLNMRYTCPLYQTPQRERRHVGSNPSDSGFITEVFLECEQPYEQWILKGAALLAQAD